MNYYIQGDPARAEQIKAAFESKGCEKSNTRDYSNEHWFFFTYKGKVICTDDEVYIDLVKGNPGYKELPLPVEPNFKVGDWVVTDYGKVSQVVSVDKAGDGYTLNDGVYFSGSWCNMYHLWTIKDVKDGDILFAKIDGDDYILIFKLIKDGWIETYCHYYITIDKFCTPTQMFYRDYQGTLYPASKEQCEQLFSKMKEAGYQWNADKKELRKIKPHYNITNFHAGMPVLVREYDTCVWQWVLYSHFNGVGLFFAAGKTWRQCIPFNEKTKHLLGTTDIPSEEFINW